MKKHIKMLGIAFALILTTMGTTNIFAASKGYNAYVSKVSDFESSSLTKKNDESATNDVDSVDGSSFVCWIEDHAGRNVTEKRSFTGSGLLHMNFEAMIDEPGDSAHNLIGKSLHLNISTSLSNFNGGTVKGTWSPDWF